MSQGLNSVTILRHVGALKRLPEYEAAKNGDYAKAALLAQSFITPEIANSIADEVRKTESILLPVVGFEQNNNNCIPSACAVRISELTGIHFADGVIRKTPDSRTHQDGIERIFNTPIFEGEVQAGARYYLLDDTITQGGTLAALARYIEENKGLAVGAAVLTGQQRSTILRITDTTLAEVYKNFKGIENDFIKTTERNFSQLTESEGRYITQASLIQRFGDETTARAATQKYGVGDSRLQITGSNHQPNPHVIAKVLSPYEIGKLRNTKPASEVTNMQVIGAKKGLGLG